MGGDRRFRSPIAGGPRVQIDGRSIGTYGWGHILDITASPGITNVDMDVNGGRFWPGHIGRRRILVADASGEVVRYRRPLLLTMPGRLDFVTNNQQTQPVRQTIEVRAATVDNVVAATVVRPTPRWRQIATWLLRRPRGAYEVRYFGAHGRTITLVNDHEAATIVAARFMPD